MERRIRNSDEYVKPVYMESIDKFNQRAVARGFQKKILCSGRCDASLRHDVCPHTKFAFTPSFGGLTFEEHSTMVSINHTLPVEFGESVMPWLSERAILQKIIRVSNNVVCIIFKHGNYRAILYDTELKEIIGIVIVLISNEETQRLNIVQCILSSDGRHVGLLGCYENIPHPINHFRLLIIQKSTEGDPVYDRIIHDHRGLENVGLFPMRIAFIPRFNCLQYFVFRVRNFPIDDGTTENVDIAKVDLRDEDGWACDYIRHRLDDGFNRDSKIQNIVFAQDGALMIVCQEHLNFDVRNKNCCHLVINTETLQILMRLREELQFNYSEVVVSVRCFINVTPSVNLDGRSMAIACTEEPLHHYQSPIYDQLENEPTISLNRLLNNDLNHLRNPKKFIKVYRLQQISLSLQSLAKIKIQKCVGNNPNKIRQLGLPFKMQQYVYDH